MKTAKRIRTFTQALFAVLIGLALLGGAGCAAYLAPVKPPQGFLYQSVKAPLTVKYNGNPCGDAVKKVSMSKTSYFLEPFLTHLDFAWDDAAIEKIAREGGIRKVSYADYETLNVLGIYRTFTIHVYGN